MKGSLMNATLRPGDIGEMRGFETLYPIFIPKRGSLSSPAGYRGTMIEGIVFVVASIPNANVIYVLSPDEMGWTWTNSVVKIF